jgi:hypothetical protein
MSTAYFPLGMSSYNNRSVYNGAVPYVPCKGTGPNSFPVGTTSGNIRPLTNNDPTNFYPQKFGLARPLKIYRKGTVIPHLDPSSPQALLISRNMSRAVKSSTKGSLIRQMIDNPGAFSIKQNSETEIDNITELDKNCQTCNGIGVVASYKPNKPYITENPNAVTTTPTFCCNEEKKARRRVVYASTNLSKNYYTTLQQYRQNRCKTYDQRSFNFLRSAEIGFNDIKTAENINASNDPYTAIEAIQYGNANSATFLKPGGELALLNSNTYVANCQPNSELLETSEIYLIKVLFILITNQKLLTPQEINEFNHKNINNFKEFAEFLKSISNDTSREKAIKIFYDFINNPYYGVPFSGPSNPKGCKLVVYKPSNPQFANQGAVTSSTRTLKLNVNTIETNLAGYNREQKQGIYLGIGPTALLGGVPEIPFLYKNKAPICNPYLYTHYLQNKQSCSSIAKSPDNYINDVGTTTSDL